MIATLCVGVCSCSGNQATSINANTTSSADTVNGVSQDNLETSDENKWRFKHFVDEFGDDTEHSYIDYVGSGTFSNTATTNSDLLFSFIVDPNGIGIALYEYGSSLVQNSYSHNVKYDIAIKDASGKKYSVIGIMVSDIGDRVFADQNELLTILKNSNNQELKFHIVNSERPSTYYNFSVDTSGFSEAYAKLFE